MQYTADKDGKVWFEVAVDGEIAARFAINARGGVAFRPGQLVEYTDAEIESITRQLLAPFSVASVPVTSA